MDDLKFRAEWLIQNQVIYAAYWGDSSIERVVSFLHVLDAMVESSERPLVHVMVDYSQQGKTLNLMQLASVMSQYKPHERVGWGITIGEHASINKFITNVGRQMLKMRQRSFPTVEEGIAFLHEMDHTLDWTQADHGVITRVLPTESETQSA